MYYYAVILAQKKEEVDKLEKRLAVSIWERAYFRYAETKTALRVIL